MRVAKARQVVKRRAKKIDWGKVLKQARIRKDDQGFMVLVDEDGKEQYFWDGDQWRKC
jgi:hypothetical protein